MSETGAGKQPDLVVPGGKARHLHLAGAAEPHAVRGERNPSQRAGDRAGEEEGQQNRQQDGDAHRDEERAALAADDPGEIAVVGGQQDDLDRQSAPQPRRPA